MLRLTLRAPKTVDIAMHDWEIPTVAMRALATVSVEMSMHDWEIPTISWYCDTH